MIPTVRSIIRRWGGSNADFLKALYDIAVGQKVGEVAVDLPNILANTTVDVGAIALPAGTCQPGDLIDVQPPATLNHGLVIQGARCVVADQLTLRVSNLTAGAIDAGVMTYTYDIKNASIPALAQI